MKLDFLLLNPEHVDKIDFFALQQQKQYLVALCDEDEEHLPHLQGLIHLLDRIQDEAALVLGEDKVFDIPCVFCHICGMPCNANTVHIHGTTLIGDSCCWDDRLRHSE